MPLEALGGLVGYLAGQEDVDQAKKLQQDALQRILGVQGPSVANQQAALNQYQTPESFNPSLEEYVQVGPSQFEGISTDPRLAQAQMTALGALQERGETGLTAKEQSELNDIRRTTARDDQARRASALQNLAQRGMAGSGAELASMLSSSQAAAERQSQESDKTAAMAQERALQAILGAGSLGGNIREQEFGEQSKIAQAADEIAKFNAANKIGQQARNVNAQNTAGLGNIERAQSVSQANTGLKNQEQLYNKGLYQSQFDNSMRQQSAAASALGNQAALKEREAARKAALGASLGKAGDEAAASAAGYMTGMPTGMPKG